MNRSPDSPKTTFWLILLPMLAAFLGERGYDAFVDPTTAIWVRGFHVHHLFPGILLVLPAAFLFAFGLDGRWARRAAAAALGLGAGFILDEFVAMIATDMTSAGYRSPVSLWGAVVGVGLFALLLAALRVEIRPPGLGARLEGRGLPE